MNAGRYAKGMFGFAAMLAMVLHVAPLGAMTLTVRGEQLIASGRIVPDDIAHFADLVAANPQLRTIVLENSPGGSSHAADEITRLVESKSLDTVAEGFCISACAMLFLSGANRTIGDQRPLLRTSIGFHGSYVGRAQLAPEARLRSLRDRVIERTQGKIDPALLDAWVHLPDQNKTVRFVYPEGTGPLHPSVFFCSKGRFANAGLYKDCRAIDTTDALRSGILTSATLTHVNP
jgi:hypothetical protein